MTQRQKEINALKSIGFSEQTAAALLFIAERFGGGEPAEPQKLVGYVTTICDGRMPLNERTVLAHIGLYVLQPVAIRELLDMCPTFAREFKPSQEKFNLPERDYAYILATGYDTWISEEKGAVVYCPSDYDGYRGGRGWQFHGTRGVMFIFMDPYYGLGPKDDTGRQGLCFSCSYDAMREVNSYVGISHRFQPGTNLGEFANMLMTEFAPYNINHAKRGNSYFLENGRTLYGR